MPDGFTLREAIEEFVIDGFRDDDGVWHDGPHRRAALAELDSLEAEISEAKRIIALCAADTTAADLRQEIEFLKAEFAQTLDGLKRNGS